MKRDIPPPAPVPALEAKRSPEKSCLPSSLPSEEEGKGGREPLTLQSSPRFYILLLPFVKFQMETSNISRGNQPNIGQRVKSRRMAQLSLRSPPLSPLHIYIHTHLYIYIHVQIKWEKGGKKKTKRKGGGEGKEGKTFGVSADRQVEEKSCKERSRLPRRNP